MRPPSFLSDYIIAEKGKIFNRAVHFALFYQNITKKIDESPHFIVQKTSI